MGTIHISDQFASDVKNFHFDNNTIIETQNNSGLLFWVNSTPSAGRILFRNNIVVLNKVSSFSNVQFDRSHNLYHFISTTNLIGGLMTQEAYGNPLFVGANDYHLKAKSPAVDSGILLGYSLDFEDFPVPRGAGPDRGAYEYHLPTVPDASTPAKDASTPAKDASTPA